METTQDYVMVSLKLLGALGLLIYGCFWLAAPLIAGFYNEPQLTVLIRVAFLALIFQSLIVVQQGLLFKSVNFKAVSKISFWAVLLSGVAGIAVSYVRRDVWGLIVQNLSFAILQTIFFWIYSRSNTDVLYQMRQEIPAVLNESIRQQHAGSYHRQLGQPLCG